MPYLTPDDIPEERACRALSIPLSTSWLATVSGALTELTKAYNWEQRGAVTVEEAVAVMQAMIDDYYEGCAECPACTLPGGARILRLNPDTGRVEELGDDDTWQAPSGDYALPAIPPREVDDPKCLAAKNAANALQILYENISDSAASSLTLAEAIADFLLAVVAIFTVVVPLIAEALLIIFGGLFALALEVAQTITADLWDTSFTEQLVCILNDCAIDTDGVITFDWECFWNNLADQTNAFDLTSDQIRLYAQIMYILQFLGGADALDQMGATTAIADDDCSFCGLPPPTLVIAEDLYGSDLVQVADLVWEASTADTGAGDLWLLLIATDPARRFTVASVENLSVTPQDYNDWRQLAPDAYNSFVSDAFEDVDGLNGFGYSRAAADDPIPQRWRFTLVQQD